MPAFGPLSIVLLIFGGCCSNVFALEAIIRYFSTQPSQYFRQAHKIQERTKQRPPDHFLPILAHSISGVHWSILSLGSIQSTHPSSAIRKMGFHRCAAFQHQHAEQLGVRVQHQCAGAHHSAQLWQCNDYACRGHSREAIQPVADTERGLAYHRRARQCLGRLRRQGK